MFELQGNLSFVSVPHMTWCSTIVAYDFDMIDWFQVVRCIPTSCFPYFDTRTRQRVGEWHEGELVRAEHWQIRLGTLRSGWLQCVNYEVQISQILSKVAIILTLPLILHLYFFFRFLNTTE